MYKHINISKIKKDIQMKKIHHKDPIIEVHCARDGCDISFKTTISAVNEGRKYCNRDCWLQSIGCIKKQK